MKLHIQDDDGNSTIVPLVREEVTIGRQEGNTIRLTDRNVSRRHGRLRQISDGGMVFEEVSARYGTRVNGSPIKGQARITPGDVIEIGDYRLALTLQAATAPSRANTVLDPPVPLAVHHGSGDESTSMIQLDAISDILDDTDARDIPVNQRARLVIISDNVRQREIRLTRTPTVIGRTDDNTVQLDHRSISRNHAKIVWSDGTYTVRDLDSANGIRVNGDFYKRSDLHSGDELELGHVVMKFLAAGDQSFPAQDDMPIAVEAPSKLSRVAFVGLIAVGLAIAAAWFFYFSKPTPVSSRARTEATDVAASGAANEPVDSASAAISTEEESAEEEAKASDEPEGEAPVQDTAPDEPPKAAPQDAMADTSPTTDKATPASAVEAAPATNKAPDKKPAGADDTKAPTAKQWLADARKDVAAGRYADARAKVGRALKAQPDARGVDALLDRIAREEKGEAALETASAAAASEQWRKAYTTASTGLLGKPSKATREKLVKIHDEARDILLASALKRGDRALQTKRYAAAVSAYREALEYDKRNRPARMGLRKAKKEQTRASMRPQVTAEKKKPEPKVEEPSNKLDTAKAYYEQARAAKRAGKLGEATSLYQKCLSTHGGMASCRAELAIVLMAQGKKCSAVRHMRSYIRLRPGGSKSAQFKRLVEQFEPQCQ